MKTSHKLYFIQKTPMIKAKDVKLLYERTGGFCECGCGMWFDLSREYTEGFGPEIHHCYRKSQYRKDDRNELWNLSLLFAEHHKNIHNGKDWELDKRLKEEADIRKPPNERSKKKVSKKPILYTGAVARYDKERARNLRNAEIDYFKKSHDGLTPSQYAYKKQKIYIDKMKKGRKYV